MRLRIDYLAVGTIGVIGLLHFALPERQKLPAQQGIVVVRGAPSPSKLVPASTLPSGLAAAGNMTGPSEPPGRVERWEGDDQPGIWATPATFSETE